MSKNFLDIYDIVKCDRLKQVVYAKDKKSGKQVSFSFNDHDREANANNDIALLLYDSLYPPNRDLLCKSKGDIDDRSEFVRAQRNRLLEQTDIYMSVKDYPISKNDLELIKQFRVLLRNLPQQEGFPKNVIWPDIPNCIKDRIDNIQTYDECVQLVDDTDQ